MEATKTETFSLNPCSCGRWYWDYTGYIDEGFHEVQCKYCTRRFLIGQAAPRVSELIFQIEELYTVGKLTKGDDISLAGVAELCKTDTRTLKKALKYMADRGLPLQNGEIGKITPIPVSRVVFHIDPPGMGTIHLRCDCDAPILIDLGCVKVCDECGKAYFACLCGSVFDVSDRPFHLMCGECGRTYQKHEEQQSPNLLNVVVRGFLGFLGYGTVGGLAGRGIGHLADEENRERGADIGTKVGFVVTGTAGAIREAIGAYEEEVHGSKQSFSYKLLY